LCFRPLGQSSGSHVVASEPTPRRPPACHGGAPGVHEMSRAQESNLEVCRGRIAWAAVSMRGPVRSLPECVFNALASTVPPARESCPQPRKSPFCAGAERGSRTPMRTKARHVLSVGCLPFHHLGIVRPALGGAKPRFCRPGGSRTLTPRWAPAPQAGVSAIPPRAVVGSAVRRDRTSRLVGHDFTDRLREPPAFTPRDVESTSFASIAKELQRQA
jgi:hypothetical protein